MFVQCRSWRLLALTLLLQILDVLAVNGGFSAAGAVLARRALRPGSALTNIGTAAVLLEERYERKRASVPSPSAGVPPGPSPADAFAAPSPAHAIAPAGLAPGNAPPDSQDPPDEDGSALAPLRTPPWLTWIPVVDHYKSPGAGYLNNSPMYKRQISQRVESDVADGDLSQEEDAPVDEPTIVPPVPTAMRCVLDLTAQFFFVYTVLFVVQTLNRRRAAVSDRDWNGMEKSLVAVLETVFFVPMLCMLFLAVRLRAIHLCQGRMIEQYNLPPWWIKGAMVICTWAVLLQTVLVFWLSLLSGEGDRWEASAKKQGLGPGGKFIMTLRNAASLTIYFSFTIICIGLCTMPAPSSLWGNAGGPPLSASVFCIILLTLLYFVVYLALACARLSNELGLFGRTVRFCQSQELLKSATATVAFVPMLCALFISARLRATQLEPKHGNPPLWEQVWFYICTFCVFQLTLLAVYRAYLQTRSAQMQDMACRDYLASTKLNNSLKVIEVWRLGSMAVLYIGVVALILGLFVSRSPKKGVATPEIPISLQCVSFLAALYFLVYLAMWLIGSAQKRGGESISTPSRDRAGVNDNDTRPIRALESYVAVRAKEAVAFCPMFCVLFLGTFMRALQITDNKGAPQVWCQTLMVLSTWSIALLTFVRFDVLFQRVSRPFSVVCETMQYVLFFLLYVSAILIVIGLYTLTPENAGIPSVTIPKADISNPDQLGAHQT